MNDNPNSNSSTETKSNKDDNFDEMINKVNEAFVKPAAPLVPNEWRTPEIEIIINECIISSNDYDGLRKCLIKGIKDQKILAPLLEKIQEIETENNKFSRQHLSGLKLALNNSNNRTFLIASCAICEKRKKEMEQENNHQDTTNASEFGATDAKENEAKDAAFSNNRSKSELPNSVINQIEQSIAHGKK
ncbi:hypothetical protein GCM10010358_83950 [Streptomyces minutiscleroticus]|uniref:Uncharacterized protein n=1 Tax=Streptomyces minutiscleroticus TaxID=68238 RepID=A0A918P6H1_9ACTN|nr:hypothetical protein GCM10010358_83950 [Streptomyces minutiscleroticus]